jgi:hypothetical protein
MREVAALAPGAKFQNPLTYVRGSENGPCFLKQIPGHLLRQHRNLGARRFAFCC